MSNEMATVLVGLVHLHYGPFVSECLFFGCKSVGFSEIKRRYTCRRYCQQDSQMRLCQFNEDFVHAEYTRQRRLFFQFFSISSNSVNSKLRIADAHHRDGKRFVVRGDEKLTAFLELERVTRTDGNCYCSLLHRTGGAKFGE